MSVWFARPSVQCCHKLKEVKSVIAVLYVVDLQATVPPVVAHVSKVVWGWREVGQGDQTPPVRFTLGFRPADWGDKMTNRIVVRALYNYWRPFQSTLTFEGHPPVCTPHTCGKKWKYQSFKFSRSSFPHSNIQKTLKLDCEMILIVFKSSKQKLHNHLSVFLPGIITRIIRIKLPMIQIHLQHHDTGRRLIHSVCRAEQKKKKKETHTVDQR